MPVVVVVVVEGAVTVLASGLASAGAGCCMNDDDDVGVVVVDAPPTRGPEICCGCCCCCGSCCCCCCNWADASGPNPSPPKSQLGSTGVSSACDSTMATWLGGMPVAARERTATSKLPNRLRSRLVRTSPPTPPTPPPIVNERRIHSKYCAVCLRGMFTPRIIWTALAAASMDMGDDANGAVRAVAEAVEAGASILCGIVVAICIVLVEPGGSVGDMPVGPPLPCAGSSEGCCCCCCCWADVRPGAARTSANRPRRRMNECVIEIKYPREIKSYIGG